MSRHDSKSEQSQVLFNGGKMGKTQGLAVSGRLVDGEADLGHGVDFTKTMKLTLDDVLALLKTITMNAPLRSLEATQKKKQAIAELELKGGFHLIQHELQKALARSYEEMTTVDPEETNRALFHREVRRAIRQGDQTLTVFIEKPNLKQPEMIVNPPENLVDKLTYYMGAYDENMRLKASPDIRISAFELASASEPGTGIEFN